MRDDPMKRNFCLVGLTLAACYLVLPTTTTHAEPTIYWTDRGSNKIQRANLDEGGVEDLVVTGLKEPVSIALDVVGGKMYWTEASPADFMIFRANLDGTNGEHLVTALTEPSGIALDTTAGKMYWTDVGTGKISRANIDGDGAHGIEDLVSDPTLDAIELALDVAHGKMYWTGSTPAGSMIFRANLDGTSAEVLVTGLGRASGIALNTAAGKIYWTDVAAGKIQRANLNGTGVEGLVTPGVSVKEPVRIALDVAAGKMYWTEGSPADFMISRANLDGSNAEFLVTALFDPSGIALQLSTGPPIPAIGSWGLVVLFGGLLVAGSVLLRARRSLCI